MSDAAAAAAPVVVASLPWRRQLHEYVTAAGFGPICPDVRPAASRPGAYRYCWGEVERLNWSTPEEEEEEELNDSHHSGTPELPGGDRADSYEFLVEAELVEEPPLVDGIPVPPPGVLQRGFSQAGRFFGRKKPSRTSDPVGGDNVAVPRGAYQVGPDPFQPYVEVVRATPVDTSRRSLLGGLVRQFVRRNVQLGVSRDAVEEDVRAIQREIDGGTTAAADAAELSPRVGENGSSRSAQQEEVLAIEGPDQSPPRTHELQVRAIERHQGSSPLTQAVEVFDNEGPVRADVHANEGPEHNARSLEETEPVRSMGDIMRSKRRDVPIATRVVEATVASPAPVSHVVEVPLALPSKADDGKPKHRVGKGDDKDMDEDVLPRNDRRFGAGRFYAPTAVAVPTWITSIDNDRPRGELPSEELQALNSQERGQLHELIDQVFCAADAENERLRTELQAALRLVEDKDEKLQAARQDTQQVQQRLVDKEAELQVMKCQLEATAVDHRELLAERRAEVTAAVKERIRLRQEGKKELREVTAKYERMLADKDIEIQTARRLVEGKDRELEAAQAELPDSERELEKLRAAEEDFKRAVADKDVELQVWLHKMDEQDFTLEVTRQDAHKRLVVEDAQLQVMERKLEELSAEEAECKRQLSVKDSNLQAAHRHLVAAEEGCQSLIREREENQTTSQKRLARTEFKKQEWHDEVQGSTEQSRRYSRTIVENCNVVVYPQRACALREDELQIIRYDASGEVKADGIQLRQEFVRVLKHQSIARLVHDTIEGTSESPTAESDSDSFCCYFSDDESSVSLDPTQVVDPHWSEHGLQELYAIVDLLKKRNVTIREVMGIDATLNLEFRFEDYRRVNCEMQALYHAWSLPRGSEAPMEFVVLDILRTLRDLSHDAAFRLQKIVCNQLGLVLHTQVAIVHAKSRTTEWEYVTVFVGTVDKMSPLCVNPVSMGAATHQLVCYGMGPQVCCGEKIRSGGLDFVLEVVQQRLRERFGDDIERTHEVVCPECLHELSPNEAATFHYNLFEAGSCAPTVSCRNRNPHRFDSRILWDHGSGCNGHYGPVDRQCLSTPVPDLPRGEVIVLAFDRRKKKWIDVGSGAIADQERGLVWAAFHTFANDEFRFWPRRRKQVRIGVRDGDNGHGIKFRYAAEILVEGSVWSDACVLRITGSLNSDGTVNPDFSLSGLEQFDLADDVKLGEVLWLLGYNQGGEGLFDPGSQLTFDREVVWGSCCKWFHCNLRGRPRVELVMNGGGPAIPGISGGPCVNAKGQVVGLQSRVDSYYGLRWYLVPYTELQKLLSRAQELCR